MQIWESMISKTYLDDLNASFFDDERAFTEAEERQMKQRFKEHCLRGARKGAALASASLFSASLLTSTLEEPPPLAKLLLQISGVAFFALATHWGAEKAAREFKKQL